MRATTIATIVLAVSGGAAATRASDNAGALVVTIDGFRNATGHARVAVFNREAGFPDDESAAYRTLVAEIKDRRVQVRFDGIPFGNYAVSMYHDENGDARFNKGLFGIPKEGYGVSKRS